MKRVFAAVVTILLSLTGFAQTDSPKTGATDTDIIAVVLGKEITVREEDNLDGLILGQLLQQFAKENKIEATDEELDAFVLKFEEKQKHLQIKTEGERDRLIAELKNPSLLDPEREQKVSQLKTIESILETTRERKELSKGMEEQMRQMNRQMAEEFVESWKINQALYKKYGGRVVFQQAGFEPWDAYRVFLKEQEKKGAFQIIDKQYETEFWGYFTNAGLHRFCDEKDSAKAINTPWWMMEEPLEE